MTISGDLEDLESALQKEDKVKIVGSGSCSALIKLLPGNRDLYVSQDSWNGFNTMLRILKKYDFQFHQTGDTSKYFMFFTGKGTICMEYGSVLRNNSLRSQEQGVS